jgi:uncharacterized radical SAM superfamily protein
MERIRLAIPSHTRTVSVTGKECALACAHCGKRYLHTMETPEEVLKRGPRHYRSALVSGGMNRGGWVPHEEHGEFYDTLLSWNWRLNFHVGLVPAHAVEVLKGRARVVSFDFLVDDVTIREVYGTGAQGRDFCTTYEMLAESFTVVPHVTIGLRGGEISGEREALRALNAYNPRKIIFLILVPTRGTLYERRLPPALPEVESLFSYARDLFPGAHLALGCMRPRGHYGEKVEELAVASGFSTIVMPSRHLKDTLLSGQDAFRVIEECCAL